MLEARRCGCRLPLLTCPCLCPRPRTLRLGLHLCLCTSIVTPLPLRHRLCFFFTFFFFKKFVCTLRHHKPSFFFLSFSLHRVASRFTRCSPQGHPLVVPRPCSVSIRYVVPPVAAPPLLTASHFELTLVATRLSLLRVP